MPALVLAFFLCAFVSTTGRSADANVLVAPAPIQKAILERSASNKESGDDDLDSLFAGMAIDVSQKSVGLGAPFDFVLEAKGGGRVGFKKLEASASFPDLQEGRVEAVRFYYETSNFVSVTELSPYKEFKVIRSTGGFELDADGFKLTLGTRYFVKVGLVDKDDRLLYLTPDFWTKAERHSVLVR